MADFNFLTNLDFAGINNCLKLKGVNLSDEEKATLNTIFENSDIYDDTKEQDGKDGKLNVREWFKFISELKAKLPKLADIVENANNKLHTKAIERELLRQVAPADNTRVAIRELPQLPKKDSVNTEEFKRISNLVQKEAQEKGIKLSSEDLNYWTSKIAKLSSNYNCPAELLIAIIGKETKFSKNINSVNGAGPMGVTTISVRDFFPRAAGNRHDLYKNIDEKLLNDILYKKDASGNFITDSKGNKVLKYKSPEEIRSACSKDDEFGMQVGLLIFKCKYAEAASKTLVPKRGISGTVKGLKNEEITPSENENIKITTLALKNYNSVFNSYAKTAVDSLKTQGVDFTRFDII